MSRTAQRGNQRDEQRNQRNQRDTRRGARPGRKPGRAGRRLAAFVGLLTVTALATGCGIRATSVPVDAGAAPSKVGCALPEAHSSPDRSARTEVVRVYLVCRSRVAPVEREVRMPGGRSSSERLPVARKLVEDLKRSPDSAEDTAGFETAVPQELTVSGGTDGDTDEALRLSVPPGELPPFALAQLVCTLADTAAADANHGVVLGGPAGPADREDGDGDGGHDGGGDGDGSGDGGSGEEAKSALQRFECDTALRTRPEAADTAGTRV